jgi:hypothetical protein
MNAIAAPETQARPAVPDRRDWLRVAGGMMFASGALVLLIRKGNDWSNWAIFAGLLIPALIMFAVVLVGRARGDVFSGWQVGFLVFGTLLLLGSFLQLVNAADGNPGSSLNLVWTFALAAAVAVLSSLALRAPFQMLLGALLGAVAWLALWDKILTNPSGDTARWLLIVLAAIYLVVAVVLAQAGRPQASDLITAAGIAAVIAAAISIATAAGALVPGALPGGVPKPSQGWNVFLLVVSLALIAYESRAPTRGPGYVGAIGLIGFIGLTGADLVNRLSGDQGGGVVGWPLILLILGAAAIVASFILKPSEPPAAPGGGYAAPAGPAAGAYAQPGATQVGGPAQGAQQPQPPGAAPQGGQPGSLLDQWRQQPPPGAPPPQQ